MLSTRKYIITNNALEKYKKYSGPQDLIGDEDTLKDNLSTLVEVAHDKKFEEWWEKDPEYGIQMNVVVDIGRLNEQMRSRTSAVLREVENGLMVVTLISDYKKREAIENRWLPYPPEAKRTRGPSESNEPINKPFENLQSIVEVKQPERIVTFFDASSHSTQVEKVGEDNGATVPGIINHLVGRGINPSSIEVWEKKPVKIKTSITIEGLD